MSDSRETWLDICWTILADRYLDFASLCSLLTVSKRLSRLVDLNHHRWHENTLLDNNVVARLERAYTESMLQLRRFGIERRTLTKRELWPYFGVELAPGNQWTIVAPSVPLCEQTNYYDLPDSESFGESTDCFDDDDAKSVRFARVKTLHWTTKSPFLRLLAMQKLRHSACTHSKRFALFSARFARSAQKSSDSVEASSAKQQRSRLLARRPEPMKKSAGGSRKRKLEEQQDSATASQTETKKSRLFAPRLVNFDPSRDSNRLLSTRH